MNIMDHLFNQEVIDREEREEARAEGIMRSLRPPWIQRMGRLS